MKKLILFLVISLLVFGSLSVAQEPDKRIEKSITKLEQVQDLLEKGDKEKAASILSKVKSEVIQARFQLLAAESERTLVGNQWAIEFPEELSVETEINSLTGEYSITVGDATIENQADEERYARIDAYLLNPEGIQRSLTLDVTSSVLSGQAKHFRWFDLFEESKFVPGTYTLLFKPEFKSKPEELRFTIDLKEKDFSE